MPTTESQVEKFFREKGIEMPSIHNGEDMVHYMGLSKYPTERAFNAMPEDDRELLKAIANIDPQSHYIRPDFDGSKLHHYNSKGIDKIANGLLRITEIRNRFPRALRIRDFYQQDPALRGME